MVHVEPLQGKSVYVCDACGLSYWEESIAQACQAYCTMHNACNLDLISKAVKRD